MKKNLRYIINTVIILICLVFTSAVMKSSAGSSCLEIQEQYLGFKMGIIADDLETCIKTGLNINNYLGLDQAAKDAASYDSEHIDAVILNETNKPIAASFDMAADDGADRLAPVFSAAPQLKTKPLSEDIMGRRILSQPFAAEKGFGHIVLVYDKAYFSRINTLFLIDYYKNTVDNIARLALRDVTDEIASLYDKGLKSKDISSENIFNTRFEDFELIDNVVLGYDTEGEYTETAFKTLRGDYKVSLNLNSDYLKKTYMWIFFSLAAAFIICIMVIIEFIPLRKIINTRINNDNATNTARTVPVLIRFISFFVYLAAFTGLPYGAIIINSRGESILGLPVSVCASLPITLEAIALLLMLSISPLIFNKTGIKKYTLLTGLCTIIPSLVCFLFSNIYTIIICSVFLGITQGLLKYLINYLISVCSENAEDISINYGEFNIGTLTGITVGGSLGSIVASAGDYSSVYLVSFVIMLIIMTAVLLCMPYAYIGKTDKKRTAENGRHSYFAFLKHLAVSPLLLFNMIFSVGVVAVALMFIVTFMPVALNLKGLSPMTVTYGFLIYGIAGNYISGYMLKKATVLRRKTAAFISMLIMAAAVLVIIPDINAITILIASLLTGIFDGFGAPSVTSALMNTKKAKTADSSFMLTGTAIIGGLGNVAAPVIYSVILYSGNMGINLCLLLLFFLFSGMYILVMRE